MTDRTLVTLEYDKVLSIVSEFAILKGTKKRMLLSTPFFEKESVLYELDKTEEAYKLLFDYGTGSIEFFDEPGDEIERAEKGASLTLGELIRCARVLKASRIIRNSFSTVVDPTISILPNIAETLYCDQYLEKEILSKIISDERVADNASEKLYQLRRKIKKLNEQIREKLNYYVHSGDKYLQENIVTMRGDRYVIPVKSEHKSKIKGFVHDQSSTGSTVFIEPIEVLELNNQLRTTVIEESQEVEAIVNDLSGKIGLIAKDLLANCDKIIDIDMSCAKAVYAYKSRSTRPVIGTKGVINIKKGRHPLIAAKTVVPLDVKLGDACQFLLITGPNTGGKTVTLKLVGLFTLMAMSGLFLPMQEQGEISLFENIYCDIGDEQSIEQSLSTFSSHIKNLIEITNFANSRSLVLIDEIGAGTDPDEGSALAQSIIESLLDRGSFGIITTHYSRLKEFAYIREGMLNASMDFDNETFAPIYKLNIGVPGTSNAIEIASRLGLDSVITKQATALLSDSKISFENVLREAEKTRKMAESERLELYDKLNAAKRELLIIQQEKEKISQERAKLYAQAKAESRRIINDKVDEAEELIAKIKEILDKEEISGGDIITARTLKNKIDNKKYDLSTEDDQPIMLEPIDPTTIKNGDSVFVKSIGSYGVVDSVNAKKGECFVAVGNMRMSAKLKDLFVNKNKAQKKPQVHHQVKISRDSSVAAKDEINVIGHRREEALDKVLHFIDAAVLNNYEEVRIVHGKGQKILSSSIHAELRKHPSVKSFRFGQYGEGENGVTIVTLR